MNSAFLLFKLLTIKVFELIYGKTLFSHKIPFGPIAGKFIYTMPAISLRMFLGIDEKELAAISKKLLREGDVVYDVGAHIGYTAVLFSGMIGVSGIVHAFELIPSTAAVLRRTIDLNSIDRCRVHNIGLGNSETVLRLPVGDTLMGTFEFSPNFKSTGNFEECSVAQLDSYQQQSKLALPTFIKMDIEGAEVKALLGAKVTISQGHPIMVIEFHSLSLLKEGLEILTQWEYRLYLLSGERITHDFVENQKQFHKSVLCVANACSWHQERLSSVFSIDYSRVTTLDV